MSPVQIAGRFMEQLGETWDALPSELAAKRTATKDLGDLVTRGLLERIGASGRRTRYRARIGHIGHESGMKRANGAAPDLGAGRGRAQK